MYFAYRDGLLTASSWAEAERTMNDLIAYPGMQQWSEVRNRWQAEEFARVVDAIIGKSAVPKACSQQSTRHADSPNHSMEPPQVLVGARSIESRLLPIHAPGDNSTQQFGLMRHCYHAF